MPRIIVVGSALMDLYMIIDRHPNIGETVIGGEFRTVPGGKGLNAAIASSRLGASVSLVAKVGDDSFGRELGGFLSESGIKSHLYKAKDARTGVGIIQIDKVPKTKISVAYGACNLLDPKEIDGVEVNSGDVLIGQLEVPFAATARLFEKGRSAHATNILNLSPMKPFDKELAELADIIIVNEHEMAHYGGKGEKASTADDVELMKKIRTRDDQTVIATLGPRGAIAVSGETVIEVPTIDVKVVDTTGAGDCFLGAIAAQTLKGTGLRAAILYANAAASICVQRMGTGSAMPTKEEVEKVLPEMK